MGNSANFNKVIKAAEKEHIFQISKWLSHETGSIMRDNLQATGPVLLPHPLLPHCLAYSAHYRAWLWFPIDVTLISWATKTWKRGEEGPNYVTMAECFFFYIATLGPKAASLSTLLVIRTRICLSDFCSSIQWNSKALSTILEIYRHGECFSPSNCLRAPRTITYLQKIGIQFQLTTDVCQKKNLVFSHLLFHVFEKTRHKLDIPRGITQVFARPHLPLVWNIFPRSTFQSTSALSWLVFELKHGRLMWNVLSMRHQSRRKLQAPVRNACAI